MKLNTSFLSTLCKKYSREKVCQSCITYPEEKGWKVPKPAVFHQAAYKWWITKIDPTAEYVEGHENYSPYIRWGKRRIVEMNSLTGYLPSISHGFNVIFTKFNRVCPSVVRGHHGFIIFWFGQNFLHNERTLLSEYFKGRFSVVYLNI